MTRLQTDKLPQKASEKGREASNDPKISRQWCKVSIFTTPWRIIATTRSKRVLHMYSEAAHLTITIGKVTHCLRVNNITTTFCNTPIRLFLQIRDPRNTASRLGAIIIACTKAWVWVDTKATTRTLRIVSTSLSSSNLPWHSSNTTRALSSTTSPHRCRTSSTTWTMFQAYTQNILTSQWTGNKVSNPNSTKNFYFHKYLVVFFDQ